jgi:hypothetical protein
LRLSEGLWRTFADIALAQGFGQVIGEGDEGRWVPLGDRARRVLHRSPLPWQAISGAGEGVFITTLALPLKEWRAQARICHWAKQGGHHWRGGVTAQPALPFRGALVEVGWRQPCMTAYAPLFASDLQDAHWRYSPMDALAPVLKLPCQRIR